MAEYGLQSFPLLNLNTGLNTSSSPVNIPNTDAVDVVNMELELSGAVSRRGAIDFIGAKDSGGFYLEGASSHIVDNEYLKGSPSMATFTAVIEGRDPLRFLVTHVDTTFYFYLLDDFLSLRNIDTPFFQLTLPVNEAYNSSRYTHTDFIEDRGRLFVSNPRILPGYFIAVITDDGSGNETVEFEYNTFQLYERELDLGISSLVNHNDISYSCLQAHTASAATEPGVGSDWREYWYRFGAFADFPDDQGNNQIDDWSLTENVTEDTFIRQVYNPGDGVTRNSVEYVCTSAHISSNELRPNDGTGQWREFWIREDRLVDSASVSTSDELRSLIFFKPAGQNPAWTLGVTQTVSSTAPRRFGTNVSPLASSFATFTFASGRMWYSGVYGRPNTVYFSQTIRDDLNYGWAFAKADPVNRFDSSPVETDGGSIIINGAGNIFALEEFQDGVLVFADNGIWQIKGGQLGSTFSATSFSVYRVSETPAVSARTITKAENDILFCGEGGIYIMRYNEVASAVDVESLTIKIDTFYTSISRTSLESSKLVYNPFEKKLYLLTKFQENAVDRDRNTLLQPGFFRDTLILDMRTQAWTKYQLADDPTGERVGVADMLPFPISNIVDNYVVDNEQNFVVDSNDNFVTSLGVLEGSQGFINILLVHKRNGNNEDVGFALTEQNGYVDFSLNSTDAVSFESRFLSAIFTFDDLIHKKQTPYYYLVFERTETGVVVDGEDIEASGCMFTPVFDYATSRRNSKWGQARQVYRPSRWNVSRYDGARVDKEVVTVKEKVRGRGNAVQLLFENDGDKALRLFGVHILTAALPRA